MLCFWLEPVRETAEEHGVEVVIYYHPHLVLQEDGSAVPSTPELYLQAFEMCIRDRPHGHSLSD